MVGEVVRKKACKNPKKYFDRARQAHLAILGHDSIDDDVIVRFQHFCILLRTGIVESGQTRAESILPKVQFPEKWDM